MTGSRRSGELIQVGLPTWIYLPAMVGALFVIVPLVAILLGYFLGNEILTPRILLAAGLIIGSVVLVSAPRR